MAVRPRRPGIGTLSARECTANALGRGVAAMAASAGTSKVRTGEASLAGTAR